MGKLTHSVSGSIASFKSMDRSDLTHLKAYFTPTQEGTGDPSPSNVRDIVGWTGLECYHYGKNLLDSSKLVQGDFDRISPERTANVVYNDLIPVKPGSTLKFDSWATAGRYIHFYNINKELQSDYNRNVYAVSTTITINVPSDSYYIKLMWYHNQGGCSVADLIATNPQVVYDSLTTYEAYNGTTIPVTFPIVGKNKFPNPAGTRSDIDLVAGVTYTVSANVTSTPYFKAIYEDGTESGYIWLNGTISGERHSNTFTPTKHVVQGLFFISDYEMTECQIEEGNAFTSYEPYSSNNTVYGGYVDLVTGEVVTTYGLLDLGTLSYTYASNLGGGAFTGSLPRDANKAKYKWTGICNKYKYLGSYNDLIGQSQGVGYVYYYDVIVKDTSVTLDDPSLIKTAMNGVMLCYELETPFAVGTLTPTQLKALAGQNHIWSSANGNVEVEYEFTDYMNKRRISLNEPHIATATGSIASFNTDMRSKLEQCKLEFTPVQSGSGDPSPTNIRPITGWTNVNVSPVGKNLLTDIYYNYNVSATGEKIVENNRIITDYIHVSAGEKYTYSTVEATSGNGGFAFVQFSFFDANKNIISREQDNYVYSLTATVPAGSVYMRAAQQVGMGDYSQNPVTPAVYLQYKQMLEKNESATTYEPYSGTTIPVTFPAFGKNLLDLNSVTVIYASMGVAIGGDNVNTKPDGSFILAAGTYTFSVNFTADVIAIVGEDGYTIGTIAINASSCTFTISKKQSIRIIISKAYAEAEELRTYHYQMEAGSFATSYEAPNNTIYGGYVDLVSGELRSDYLCGVVDTTSTAVNTSVTYSGLGLIMYAGSKIFSANQAFIASELIISDKLTHLQNPPAGARDITMPWSLSIYLSNGYYYFVFVGDDTVTTKQAWEDYFTQNGGIRILAKATNPKTYSLTTTQQLKSLVGQNNIWSSANSNTTVKYWKHN